MVRALLDVNVLVALLDASHLHHRAATDWLADHAHFGWASCPLTQNGCLRILALPSYPNPQSTASVAQRLGQAAADPSHEFWPDGFSLLDEGRLNWIRILTSRQITDTYLMALAVERGGRLITFNKGINVEAVRNASKHNLVTLA